MNASRSAYSRISTSLPASPNWLQTVSAVTSSMSMSVRSAYTHPSPTELPSTQPSIQSPCSIMTSSWVLDRMPTLTLLLAKASSLETFLARQTENIRTVNALSNILTEWKRPIGSKQKYPYLSERAGLKSSASSRQKKYHVWKCLYIITVFTV